MSIRNTSARWGYAAQAFHWIIVALLIAQFVLANIAEDQKGLAKLATLAQHKSVGITILGLAVLRLAWRLANPVPAVPPGMPTWERRAAGFVHTMLYVLLFALPLTGWTMSSARNFPVSWFGLVQLPDLVRPDKGLYETLHEVHETLASALFVFAVLHVVAALRHHFWLKDDILLRMLPFTGRRTS